MLSLPSRTRYVPKIDNYPYTSTPGVDRGLERAGGAGYRNAYSDRGEDQPDDGRTFVDITDLRVQHLTELLESERRAVKLLSYFSNVDLGDQESPKMNVEVGHSQTDLTNRMPELENMLLTRVDQKTGPEGPKLGDKKKGCVTAQDVYSQSWGFDRLLNPEKTVLTTPVGSQGGPEKSVPIGPGHEELVCLSEAKETAAVSLSETKNAEGASSGRTPRMKPTQYDGKTPYEDYQVQFCMLSELNGWSKNERALYLAGSLGGSARSVLNDIGAKDRYDYDKLDEALRERFGTDDQSELFKAKLRNRVKSREETLQELAHDVRRLVRLAYPKAAIRTHNDLTKDQFIEALGDSEVRWSVFQARPRDLTEALKVAMELEAFKESEKCRMRRNIRGVMTNGLGDHEADVGDGDRADNLGGGSLVAQRLVASGTRPGSLGRNVGGGPEVTGTGRSQDFFGGEGGNRPGRSTRDAPENRGQERGPGMNRVPVDISKVRCYRCDRLGHYVRNCPDLPKRGQASTRRDNGLNEESLDQQAETQ
jgi:hypothetical protein